MAKQLTPTRPFETWVVKHGVYKTVALDALARVVAKGWQPVTDDGQEFTIQIDEDGTVPTDEYGRPALTAGTIPDKADIPESALTPNVLTAPGSVENETPMPEIAGLTAPVPGGDTPAGGTPDGAPDVPSGGTSTRGRSKTPTDVAGDMTAGEG